MTEILRDACDTFDKWRLTGANPSVIATGRNGNGFRIGSANNSINATIPKPWEDATVLLGFAFQFTDSGTAIREIIRTTGDDGTNDHNRLRYTLSTTTLDITRGSTVLGSNAAVTLARNAWNYIELKLVMSDTVGVAIVRVNGTEVINVTAQDTKNGGSKAVFDMVKLYSSAVGHTHEFDDIYLRTGAAETFAGDPGAVTTSPTLPWATRQQMRVAASVYDIDGWRLARHATRVAVGIQPANTAAVTTQQMRVAVGGPPPDTAILAALSTRVATSEAVAKVRIGSVPVEVVASAV